MQPNKLTDGKDLTKLEEFDKILFKILKEMNLISLDNDWELFIGGNRGGIRYVRKTEKVK